MRYISKFRLHKKCPYDELSWSLFSHIRTEYGDLQSTSPYSLQMQEIRTRKTPYTDTFHAVLFPPKFYFCNFREPTSNWFYQTFSNLKPFTDYKINVSCKSDKGIGPAANITLNTRQYGKLKLNLCLVPTKWSNTRQKSCNKCWKVFNVRLTILWTPGIIK